MNTESFLKKYGPWAVVTGASDGIGQAFARKLAQSGVKVVLVARRQERLEALAHELHQTLGTETLVVAADLATPDGLQHLKDATANLDVGLLVASAGFGSSGDFLGNDVTSELAMIDVNCRALVDVSHHYGAALKAKRRGGVILLSSIMAFQGAPHAALYAATKAFVQTFAEGWHPEMKPFGVDVLAVAPGPTKSGFAKRAGMTFSFAAGPNDVAMNSLRALGRKTTVYPGMVAAVLALSLVPLPRWARVRVMGATAKGMSGSS